MKDRINLYTQYLEMSREEREFPFQNLAISLLALSLVIVVFFYTSAKIDNNRLLREEALVSSYVESETNIRKYENSKENQAMIEERNELLIKVQGVNGILLEKRQINPALFTEISLSLPYGVQLSNFDFNGGIATVDYESISMDGPSIFAQNLSNRPLIQSLNYQGFTKVEQTIELDEPIDNNDDSLIESTERETRSIYTGTIEMILEGGY